MRNLIERLAPFDKENQSWNVVVEISKGCRLKYAYDPESGLLALKQALPEGMVFPFNFGFIPGTTGDDGDPLDILIVNALPVEPLTLVKVKLVGVIKAEQTEDGKTERNDRIVGVAITKLAPASLKNTTLDKEVLSHIEHFFVSYNKLHGRKFKMLNASGPKEAEKVIRKGMQAFRKVTK